MTYEEIETVVNQQKAFFQARNTFPIVQRKNKLIQLKNEIKKREKEVEEALFLDLGKSSSEAYMTEIGMVYEAIHYMVENIDRLARTKRVPTPISLFKAHSELIREPYGCVLVVSPWNYPFLLTFQPMIEAIAAGNTVVLKPSNYSRHTSDIIETIVKAVFPSDYVRVIKGGRTENQSLFQQPFDMIFFTGSISVGKEVMKAASQNLVPVVLELGGKSPCIVDEQTNIALAAKRIVFGKFLNAGQTCVSVDHVYVHASQKQALLQQIIHQIHLQYPTLESMGKIIDQRHYVRLKQLLDDGIIEYGGRYSDAQLKIEPTVMVGIKKGSKIDTEEIFGPILPIYVFEDYDQLIKDLAKKPHPLAAYLFSKDLQHIETMKRYLPFGGGCINNTILHLANIHLPFGGLQNSGMGHYHGEYGFHQFSHEKGMLHSSDWIDLPFIYRPYTKWKDEIIQFFMR